VEFPTRVYNWVYCVRRENGVEVFATNQHDLLGMLSLGLEYGQWLMLQAPNIVSGRENSAE